jgi:phage terminase large subunit GpA-like protein
MKIIQQGRAKQWWHGLVVGCRHCGQLVELEPGDDALPCFDASTITQSVRLVCQNCGAVTECQRFEGGGA